MSRYRVAIVYPSSVIAEGVRAVLTSNACAEVVLLAHNIPELMLRLRSVEVDVVLVAASAIDAVVSCSDLADIPTVAIQATLAEGEQARRFAASFSIYDAEEDIVRTVREAVEAPAESNHNESHELSERERDVLILVARGMTNKEIASELNISPHTVISHRKNIVHKTGIRSVAGLTVYAVLNKLIDSE